MVQNEVSGLGVNVSKVMLEQIEHMQLIYCKLQ